MKNISRKLTEYFNRLINADFFEALSVVGLLSIILNLVLEALGRGSVISAVLYMVTSPISFVLNTLIILLSLSVFLFTKRRIAPILFVSVLWLSLGIANAVVLTYRSTPLSAIDFLVIKSMAGMTTIYFSTVQLVLTCIGIAAVIGLLVFLFIKCPPCKVYRKKTAASILVIMVSIGLLNLVTVNTKKTDYATGEVDKAYRELGFVYCFSTSIVSQGVDRPADYGESSSEEIIEELIVTDTENPYVVNTVPESLPNIIVLQLESFIDLSGVKGIEFSEDPTPNFTRLKSNGVSGYLRVPHVGGGTSNVEFEVLTGMNLDHFGFGEYPYTTVLRTTACESLAANLKEAGYITHAMHNHIASFYDRDLAYASLGFDTFTPIEMMTDITRNPLGWARDEVLVHEILSALDMTEDSDFVFAVSVQGHGKYPEEPIDESSTSFNDNYSPVNETASFGDIEVFNVEDDSVRNQIAYYANQIHEMDAVIGQLISELEHRGEPYALIVYGDHMPALPIDESDLLNPDLYETEYAIATNIDLSPLTHSGDTNELDRNMEAYMLSAYVQKLFGFRIGEITALHQYELDTGKNCDNILKTLEYTQLYDHEKTEFEPTSIRFGTRDVKVTSFVKYGNTLYVYGDGFNEYSVINIDGLKRTTEFVNSGTLRVDNVFFAINDIKVVQLSESGTELTEAIYE